MDRATNPHNHGGPYIEPYNSPSGDVVASPRPSRRGDHGRVGIELRHHPHRARSSAAALVRDAALYLLSHPRGTVSQTAAGAVAESRGLWASHWSRAVRSSLHRHDAAHHAGLGVAGHTDAG